MEKWREVYTEEQIKHVQQIEMRNLSVLKDVCSKLGIPFFVYGGTLIGAVRHKGFVPWDDDLDVAMLRSDYMKFSKEAPRYLPDEYELQSPYTDSKTPYFYLKLRLKGTRYIEYGYHKLDIEQGIYIDIYPIDNLSDDDEAYYKQFKEYQFFSRLFAWRQCPYLSNQKRSARIIIKKTLKWLISCFLKLIPRAFFLRKLDNIATRYNHIQTERKGNLSYPKPVNVFYNIFPLEEGTFNGQTVMLPGNWDRHLTSRYGDYMQLPPEDQRLGHRPYLLDFGTY